VNPRFADTGLRLAVNQYHVLFVCDEPVKGAALGVACVHLRSRLNLTLLHAVEMLRGTITHMATEDPLKAAHGPRSQRDRSHSALPMRASAWTSSRPTRWIR